MSETNQTDAAVPPLRESPLDRFRNALQVRLAAVKAELPGAANGDPRAAARALDGLIGLLEDMLAGPAKSDPPGA